MEDSTGTYYVLEIGGRKIDYFPSPRAALGFIGRWDSRDHRLVAYSEDGTRLRQVWPKEGS